MANTFRKIYLHVVFAVKFRQALLEKSWRGKVFRYIAGILNQRGHFSLAVNGPNDHIHIFFDYKDIELLSDLVREIKKASTNFINREIKPNFKFQWQSGYAVFSCDSRDKDSVIKYILNQETHHSQLTFKDEYLKFLEENEIQFEERYLFDFIK